MCACVCAQCILFHTDFHGELVTVYIVGRLVHVVSCSGSHTPIPHYQHWKIAFSSHHTHLTCLILFSIVYPVFTPPTLCPTIIASSFLLQCTVNLFLCILCSHSCAPVILTADSSLHVHALFPSLSECIASLTSELQLSSSSSV